MFGIASTNFSTIFCLKMVSVWPKFWLKISEQHMLIFFLPANKVVDVEDV